MANVHYHEPVAVKDHSATTAILTALLVVLALVIGYLVFRNINLGQAPADTNTIKVEIPGLPGQGDANQGQSGSNSSGGNNTQTQ